MIKVYASEQTNSRSPGVRLVCVCGWGIVAVHGHESRDLIDVIDRAMAHLYEAHGLDEMPPGGPRSQARAAPPPASRSSAR